MTGFYTVGGMAVGEANTLNLNRKALYLDASGKIREHDGTVQSAPLVLLNGAIKQRVTTEGVPLVLDNGGLRLLASGETINTTYAGASSWATQPVPTITTYATFTTDKSANIIISTGTTATLNTVANSAARATIGKSTGKWYWEGKMTKTTAAIGLGTSGASLSAMLGNDTLSMGYNNSGQRTTGGVSTTLATYTTTDVIGIALDMDNKTIEFFKNNVSQGKIAIPAAMQGAALYPMVSLSTTKNAAVTMNFGATALTYTPPSGFASGIGT